MESADFVKDTALDLNLQHLRAELARLDILLREAIRRWQLAGQDPTDAFRGLYVSDDQAEALLARPLNVNWGHTIALSSDQVAAFTVALSNAEAQIQALEKTADCQGKSLHLAHLSQTFGLNRFERDALLICLAPNLDQRYEKVYGYLQDDITRKRPSVNLILDLLCEPGLGRCSCLVYFADQSALFRNGLLEKIPEPGKPSLLSCSLGVDGAIVSWLLGTYRPHTDLSKHARLTYPDHKQTDQLLAGEILSSAESVLHEDSILVFSGPDTLCQEAAARLLAVHWQRALLTLDLATLLEEGMQPLRALKLALRDACLVDAIPLISGWDACLVDGAPAANVFAELCTFPGAAIVAGYTAWQPKGIQRERNLIRLDFPLPIFQQRLALWHHFVGQLESQSNELAALAGQFQLTSAQIRDAVASARDIAAQRGDPLQTEDLFTAARGHSNPHLVGLARKINLRYRWEDIVLPADQLDLLREIVATVRFRPKVLDEWGVGQKLASSRGVTALFAGPPGTGKTMAAEVIAADLGLDLYKIDLSTVISKYIGETEKNLERIFNEAETSNAILFFDEADALFGKRSEVRDSHDRYANIEISYLLQRMEAYNGITILATNLRANLDEAFTRRLQFVVDFPFPDQADRLRIWQTLFPLDLPYDADLNFSLMASRFKLAGGNIRNIIVSAAYLAADDGQRVTMEHLLHGTRRELQKMGRLIGEEYLTAE